MEHTTSKKEGKSKTKPLVKPKVEPDSKAASAAASAAPTTDPGTCIFVILFSSMYLFIVHYPLYFVVFAHYQQQRLIKLERQ